MRKSPQGFVVDRQMDTEAFAVGRRHLLGAAFIGVLTLWPRPGHSGPLDSIPLTPGAKILREGSALVPARLPNGPGLAGADIYASARAWLDVDFAVADQADLTLMILTQQQNDQVSRGQRPTGDPLARVAIEGPETANHSVVVGVGRYFVRFLNTSPRAVAVAYRLSIRAF